jgi:hypothetical protein
MKVRSKLVGVMLVLILVLAAYSVPAQKKPGGERRDAVSDIDAGIDKHARQMLETGRRVFRFDTFAARPSGAKPCSSTRPSPARRTGGPAAE